MRPDRFKLFAIISLLPCCTSSENRRVPLPREDLLEQFLNTCDQAFDGKLDEHLRSIDVAEAVVIWTDNRTLGYARLHNNEEELKQKGTGTYSWGGLERRISDIPDGQNIISATALMEDLKWRSMLLRKYPKVMFCITGSKSPFDGFHSSVLICCTKQGDNG